MRLAEGIVVDEKATFGEVKFSAMRRARYEVDAEGKQTTVVKERTYDLMSKEAGMMIQVSIPGEIPEKEFEYLAEVELIDPIIDTVANATYRGADVDWYVKAKDIVLKKGVPSQPVKEPIPKQSDDKGKETK
jgi:hypothetical protein